MLTCPVWIIQYIGDFFGTFVNDKSIVCNTSFFFGFECTKIMFGAINLDLCYVLLPFLGHSDQTSRRIGFFGFSTFPCGGVCGGFSFAFGAAFGHFNFLICVEIVWSNLGPHAGDTIP